ncbi:MAG TPA: hypothetical protein DCR97_09845 [Deltaproteobacteria bacterium]|nr:hypothetical protein [Deltaproteobacteria bacterium]
MQGFMTRKVSFGLAVGALCGVFCFGAPEVRGGETDALLQLLKQKGVLTQEEAEQLKSDAQKASAEQEKKMEEKVAKTTPDWVKNLKFKGDVRARYQSENIEDDNKGQRDRGRFRLRFGAETSPIENFSLGFGIASGSDDDPRSTNQTMGGLFSKKEIWIDYAYGQYRPTPWLSLTGGRFANPIWQPFEFLWDNDIRPEGVAAVVKTKPTANFGFFLTTGYLILDEKNNTHESGFNGTSYMAFLQPGIDWRMSDKVNLKLAASYYFYNNLDELDFSTTTHSGFKWSGFKRNTLDGKRLKYDYDAPTFEAELGFKKLFGDCIPYIGLFGQYTYNPDPHNENKAYITGVKLGSDKIGKLGDWQIAYAYRELEVDAWPDFLPYSDFYNGYTGAKGHQAQFSFGLAKNTSLAVNFLRADPLSKTKGQPVSTGRQNLVQVDLNWKF